MDVDLEQARAEVEAWMYNARETIDLKEMGFNVDDEEFENYVDAVASLEEATNWFHELEEELRMINEEIDNA